MMLIFKCQSTKNIHEYDNWGTNVKSSTEMKVLKILSLQEARKRNNCRNDKSEIPLIILMTFKQWVNSAFLGFPRNSKEHKDKYRREGAFRNYKKQTNKQKQQKKLRGYLDSFSPVSPSGCHFHFAVHSNGNQGQELRGFSRSMWNLAFCVAAAQAAATGARGEIEFSWNSPVSLALGWTVRLGCTGLGGYSVHATSLCVAWGAALLVDVGGEGPR